VIINKTIANKKAPSGAFFIHRALSENYLLRFTAFAFGRSVIEPSNTSAARPIDSCNVG
jgi:hypothetical protein